MPRDGAGNYTLPSGNPVVTNTVISSSGWANPTLTDIAAALTMSLSRDGQTTPTADLTMGNFKLRALAAAVARSDAVNAAQVQDSTFTTLSSVTGTDTITATTAPAITTYTAGQEFSCVAPGTNTTNAVTLNINALGAKSVLKMGASGLVQLSPGDIRAGQALSLYYDGTQFQLLTNIAPVVPIPFVNKVLNGNFDIWQRGTSFSAATTAVNAYTADGWQVYRSTFAAGYTVLQGSGFVPTGSRFSLYVQRTAGDTSTQPINISQSFTTNDVIKMRGKTFTLSLQGQAAGAFVGASLFYSVAIGTGTDGNLVSGFTGISSIAGGSIVMSGVYSPASITFTVPTNATQLGINIFVNPSSTAAGSGDTFQIAQVQINEGASALPFERRAYQDEFRECRFFYRTVLSAAMWGYASAGGFLGQTIGYEDMRASPTVTVVSPSYANASGLTVSSPVTNSLTLYASVTALGAASWSCSLILNASL